MQRSADIVKQFCIQTERNSYETDTEGNKVRTQIVNYLIRSGCHRIQKSIFLANLSHDSILLVPISTDYLQAMKIIGQTINVDVITKNKNTLFFK